MSTCVRREGALRKTYIDLITAAWRKTVEGILDAGRLLIEAKEQIDHGEFMGMVEHDLPFSISTAERLMKIGRDPRIMATEADVLPQSWRTLYELSKVEDEEWDELRPQLSADLTRADVRGMIRELRGEMIAQPIPLAASHTCPRCGCNF